MQENNRAKGSRYEELAAACLVKQGINIIERNFRCRIGEIDIVARDGNILCFIEVKYRSGVKAGFPAEAVGPAKQRKIFNVAAFYLIHNRLPQDTPCRFDVISVIGDKVTYIKNAFGGM